MFNTILKSNFITILRPSEAHSIFIYQIKKQYHDFQF
jgi:hypothetical protein